MPALRDEDKPALLDEQHSLRNAQAGWTGVLGVVSAIGVATPATLIPGAVSLGVGSVMYTVLQRKVNAIDRVLSDPPRRDFQIATRARRRRYITGALGDSQVATATDRAAIATLRVAAYFEAAVRADERAQGAELAGRPDTAEMRLDEARRLFDRGRVLEADMAASLDSLGIAWAAFAAKSGFDSAPVPDATPPPGLPPVGAESLDRVGLVTWDLDLSRRVPATWNQAGRQRVLESRNLLDVALNAARETRALAQTADRFALPDPHLTTWASTRRRQLVQAPEEYYLGLRARDRGDVEEARRLVGQAADQGSVDALFELGLLAYQRGAPDEARRLLEQAADKDELTASELYEIRLEKPDLPYPELPSPPRRLGAGDNDQGG